MNKIFEESDTMDTKKLKRKFLSVKSVVEYLFYKKTNNLDIQKNKFVYSVYIIHFLDFLIFEVIFMNVILRV